MKNNLIKKMFIILIITVILAAGGVYTIVFLSSQGSFMAESVERADYIMDYIVNNLENEGILESDDGSDYRNLINQKVQNILDDIRGLGGFKRLYMSMVNEAGEIITSNTAGSDGSVYFPSGIVEADLRRSIEQRTAVIGERIYRTDDGSIFTVFRPIMVDYRLLGVVCMEFDADFLSFTNPRSLTFGLALSGGLVVIISLISYLSMSRASEPYFKKLAYTDFLTGYENRMSFEQRLRECGDLAVKGEYVTLIICDVNNLKVINDTQGHKVGDAYIKSTADLIVDNLKGAGPLYRIGGDEFASIIVGKDERGVGAIMSALRTERRIAVKGQRFSCACGAAMYTEGVDATLRDVFKRADESMYKEKKRQKAALGTTPRDNPAV